MSVVIGATQESVDEDGRHRTTSRFAMGPDVRTAFFTTDSSIPRVQRAKGDIWLPSALVIAMARRLDLVIEDTVSDDRLGDLETVQDILMAWYPEQLRRPKITATTESSTDPTPAPTPSRWRRGSQPARPEEPQRLRAACFTGGVDSFYTLNKNLQDLDALLYGYGIDVPLTEVSMTERVADLMQQVSDAHDLQLLTAETNIRRVIGPKVSWGFYAHGAGLISLATLFSPVIGQLRIPATHAYDANIPWGSHPLLDRHWSTARLQVVHDGGEATRSRKIAGVAHLETAQRHLRVCYAEFDDLNCARCMKCMRTMLVLAALDRLDDFSTFARPLDLDDLASRDLKTENDVYQFTDVQNFLATVDGHEDIKRAIDRLLQRHHENVAAGHIPWRPSKPADS